MKTLKPYYSLVILFITALLFIGYACSSSKQATSNADDGGLGDLSLLKTEKSGAVLWGENCGNCHNSPDPASFTDKQWKTLGKHMRMRAGLTEEEIDKIVTFLQQSN